LKTANVMMCRGVGPVVMDFGLARQSLQANDRLTRTGTTMGTPPTCRRSRPEGRFRWRDTCGNLINLVQPVEVRNK
jgi:hypothetical protein